MTDTVRERHHRTTITDADNGDFYFCDFCDQSWPCDTAIETARADAAERESAELRSALAAHDARVK